MTQTVEANRATHLRAYAANPDGVIIAITTTSPAGVDTTLPNFWLSREQWSAMVSMVDTALAIPDPDAR